MPATAICKSGAPLAPAFNDDLTIIRRPKLTTSIHELERCLACKDCTRSSRYSIKGGQLVALRKQPIAAATPPSTWWPGER